MPKPTTAPPWRFRAALRAAALTLQPALVACRVGSFACDGADACVDAGARGTCQPDGWCSFDDASCASGQRYGAHAPAGIAGACVELVASTGDLAGTSSASTTTGASDDDADASSDGHGSASGSTGEGICGDGTVDPDEACDPGFDGFGACTPACQPNVCGDGWVGPGEDCDGGESCDASCRLRCGNGVLDGREVCDASVPDPGALDCHALGFEAGMASCRGCELDTSACVPCPALGCSCAADEPCPPGRSCVTAPLGTPGRCLLDCETDDDCGDDTHCIDQHCAITCTPLTPVCPRGTSCSQLPPNSICL